MQELSRADEEYVARVIRETGLWNYGRINPVLTHTCGFKIVRRSGEIRMEITNEHRYLLYRITNP